ncbi:MAG TPA: glycogen debranching protein GlgX [Rhodanobacteraceae bacterium]|nr:glycogen debranching protein GlgX [Rhodanobacteraceae bacterium]
MASYWPDRLQAGRPWPLGAHNDGLGTNFAVFSEHATRIELCLFDDKGHHEQARLDLPQHHGGIWHGYLPHRPSEIVYGYRAHGPYEPKKGHRFNSHKLLLDPYARELRGGLRWSNSLFGYRIGAAGSDMVMDKRDSAGAMPKGVVNDDHYAWGNDVPPRVPWERTVIYECHLRGISMLRNDLPRGERGTFAALADPRFIDHLLALGVTAIELLPVQSFVQDRRLLERELRNYWGYNPLCWFAPEPRYLSRKHANELRHAVHHLHKAGIEVIMDVVYNHTAEGNELGPTLSLRGLDNASYYRLQPDSKRYYLNASGCGNTLNLAHPQVLRMALDSLRYWVESYHIDGFRFDLGVTLGRESQDFDPGAGFFDALLQDPTLAQIKLIAEPWDIGKNGYQLGGFPPRFAEWNDRYRDTVRRYWRGDSGQRGELAARISGSGDIFAHPVRANWSSVNFLASHDGFSLADVVSYAHKHNEANGEGNKDGHDENFSANHGHEGPTDDARILADRRRAMRAMLCTLMCSQGTPMLLAGDEFAHSKGGNNNSYCQDNKTNWLDWSRLDGDVGREQCAWVARLSEVRRKLKVLGMDRFLYGEREAAPGITEIAWFDESAAMDNERWRNGEGRLLTLRRALRGKDGDVEISLFMVNSTDDTHRFHLPPPEGPWRMLLDSSAEDGVSRSDPISGSIDVPEHTALLLLYDGDVSS